MRGRTHSHMTCPLGSWLASEGALSHDLMDDLMSQTHSPLGNTAYEYSRVHFHPNRLTLLTTLTPASTTAFFPTFAPTLLPAFLLKRACVHVCVPCARRRQAAAGPGGHGGHGRGVWPGRAWGAGWAGRPRRPAGQVCVCVCVRARAFCACVLCVRAYLCVFECVFGESGGWGDGDRGCWCDC